MMIVYVNSERYNKIFAWENYVKIELFTTRIRLNCQNVSAFIYKDCLTIDLRGRQPTNQAICSILINCTIHYPVYGNNALNLFTIFNMPNITEHVCALCMYTYTVQCTRCFRYVWVILLRSECEDITSVCC